MSTLKTATFMVAVSVGLGSLTSCKKSIANAQLASTVQASQGEAQGVYNAAQAAETTGDTGKALKLYRKVTEDYPLSIVAAEAQYRVARILDDREKLLDAFDAYDALLSKYPASPYYSAALERQITLAHAAAGGKLRTPTFIGLKTRIESRKTVEMLTKVRDHAPRSASAVKIQFTIGEVWQRAEKIERAIPAFQELAAEYPDSPLAPQAQYRIGELLLKEASEGNQDQANLDRARRAFDDVILRYPDSREASAARKELKKIASGNIARTFNTAEFYRKKGQTSSALFYYKEVVRQSKSGPLQDQAKSWIAQLRD